MSRLKSKDLLSINFPTIDDSFAYNPPSPLEVILLAYRRICQRPSTTISGIRKVGRAKRFFLGDMAGRSSMTADVEFVDGDSGIVLGRYEIVGKSGNTRFTGVTVDAVEKTAEAIVAVVAEGYSAFF